MKIAVTYDNGNVFQHFGRTEQFKIYDVENGKIVSSEVIGNDGLGHGALAGLLANNAINVLICGGLGGGAMNALTSAGIEVVAGATGNTDAAVEAYLKGELVSSGANCDHHDHHHGEDHVCGDHGCGHHEEHDEGGCCGHHDSEEGSCCGSGANDEGGCCGQGGDEGGCCGSGSGSDCGSCGGCGDFKIILEGPNAGKIVRVHYEGTLNDGTKFDSSYDRGEPLEFMCGAGMMIAGFDKAVVDMAIGEVKNIHLMPEEAYGERDPEAILKIQQDWMPGCEKLNVGERVVLTNPVGQPFPATVIDKDEFTITFDANHEMAGKELNFKIELVEIV